MPMVQCWRANGNRMRLMVMGVQQMLREIFTQDSMKKALSMEVDYLQKKIEKSKAFGKTEN